MLSDFMGFIYSRVTQVSTLRIDGGGYFYQRLSAD